MKSRKLKPWHIKAPYSAQYVKLRIPRSYEALDSLHCTECISCRYIRELCIINTIYFQVAAPAVMCNNDHRRALSGSNDVCSSSWQFRQSINQMLKKKEGKKKID